MPETASPVTAEPPPAPRFAGFWIRVGSFWFDMVLLQVLLFGAPIVDIYLMDGELGTDNSYETASHEVVEESEVVLADGSVMTVVKSIETRLDFKGRSATFEIEETTVGSPGTTRSRTQTRRIDSEPGWGGKYKSYFAAGMLLAILVYFAALWSSRYRSTLAGRIIGLRVTDYQGNRISRPRALARVAAAVLSLMTVIGFLMIVFTRRKQALHDLVAGTLVVRE